MAACAQGGSQAHLLWNVDQIDGAGEYRDRFGEVSSHRFGLDGGHGRSQQGGFT
jgi:hypothetical protein